MFTRNVCSHTCMLLKTHVYRFSYLRKTHVFGKKKNHCKYDHIAMNRHLTNYKQKTLDLIFKK